MIPSRWRFVIASSEWASRMSLRWSVSTRLCSSGIARSKLRRPASIWATGMPSFTAASAAGERRVDVAGDDAEVDLVLEQDPLDADQGLGGLLGVASRADAEEHVRPRHPELAEEDVRHLVVVVLPRVQEQELQGGIERGQLPVDRSRLHEVRPRADDKADASRHAGDPTVGSTLGPCWCSRSCSGSRWARSLWTHVVYPLGAAALARVRTRRVRKEAIEPHVTVIVAAYNEEPVIERRLENLLALDYPADKLELVVTSDASTDRTHELVERFGDRVRLIVNPRGGKVAAQNRAVRETGGEIVAFSDANATWAPDALRQLVAQLRRPRRRLRLRAARARGGRRLEPARASTGATSWRSARPSRGSARSPAATARSTPCAASDYVEVDPKWGHDLSFPYRMVQARAPRGLRAAGEGVREADAVERDRVPAQGAHVRALLGDHPARLDAEAAAARLPRRGDLAPAAPLRQRAAPPRPARDVARARRRGARLPARARGAAAAARRRGRRGRDRALLHRSSPGRPSSRSGTTSAAACPRRGRRRRGRAESRRSTSRSPAPASAIASPLLAAAALAVKLERRRPGPLQADPRRQGRRATSSS